MDTPFEDNAQDLLHNNTEKFLHDLRRELHYFHRTKIVTLMDVYRIRKRLIPRLDAWICSENLSYNSLLKIPESLLFHALRCESSLSDIKQMVNENKYTFRNGIKTIFETLPDSD